MSKVHTLRAFISQRLTAAAEEILTLFERTISEYEEEIKLQHRLLQHIQDDKAVFSANVKKITDQQQWSPSSDPDPPHIKEEQQEVWSSQEAEQLQGLEEADITKFTSTHISLKSEDDEEKPQSSQLHQRLSEENREADPSASSSTEHMQTVRNPDPDRHLQPASDKTSNFSETDDSNVWWKQLREPQSGLNALKNSPVPVSDVGCNASKKSFSCSECGKRFSSKDHLQIHMTSHTGEKTFTCPFCGKKFTKRSNLTTHLRVHTGEKPFTCSVCNTSFSLRCTLVNHMRVHTGEKPFSCSVCSKRFSKKANLKTHMALHTEEKPFQCRVCDKRFTWHSQVKNHKCV